ncbi:MAG: 5-oxoprolinase [Gemmatimonadales bacterium]|nr:MAG: 5-oxoprolinase [Gemmatimonadales bacterium]
MTPTSTAEDAPEVSPGRWSVHVDTGGTFTDCLAVDPRGRRHRLKVLSSSALRGTVVDTDGGDGLGVRFPDELPDGFLVGFGLHRPGEPAHPGGPEAPLPRARLVVEAHHRDPHDPRIARLRPVPFPPPTPGATVELRSPETAPLLATRLATGTPAGSPLPGDLRLRVATTRATNALLERKGAPSALVVTRGFGDVLRIGDQSRPDLFALDVSRPPPLVVEVVEVPGRIGVGGEILEGLVGSTEGPEDWWAPFQELRRRGIGSAAVVLLHSPRNPAHEERVAEVLRAAGFDHVAVSHEVAPFTHFLRRAETTVVEAYLAPVIQEYLAGILAGLGSSRVQVMTSAGGLTAADRVRARETLLSGPAGGVVGAGAVARRAGLTRIITLDMGGTSTDVARFDGRPQVEEEHTVGPARLRTPAVAMETVAAGGGSICRVHRGELQVGPESAGADPGPACYGAGGPLTLTDVNLLLGRIDPNRFGIPVHVQAARIRAEEVLAQLRDDGRNLSLEQLLEAFLELADERMAGAVRRISVRQGYDPAEYGLVAFGGAGAQHACALARRLDIRRVVLPEEAGILSAVGLEHAAPERVVMKEVLAPLATVAPDLDSLVQEMRREARAGLVEEGADPERIQVRDQIVHLRYAGQESTLEVPLDVADLRKAFEAAYQEVFGHRPEGRALEVVSLRVTMAEGGTAVAPVPTVPSMAPPPPGTSRAWFDGAWREVPVWEREALAPGSRIHGPALIRAEHTSVVVASGWRGRVHGDGSLVLEADAALADTPVALHSAAGSELFAQRFRGLVTEMGEQLRRTAISVNIRERRDYSCALLDPQGRLVAHAPHVPVHLGAMGACVRAVAGALDLRPGDTAVTNHPGAGGSHLPDVTVITPVHAPARDGGEPPLLLGYVASRAHHAEIGGRRPGSMPPDARSLQEEGVVIEPQLLVRDGEARWDELRALLLAGPYPTRRIEENLVDLAAQVAANHRGASLLRSLAATEGGAEVVSRMEALERRAALRIRAVLASLPDGIRSAVETLDDGSPLSVRVEIQGDEATVDFTGSSGVHPGNLNATPAIVRSCVLYVLRLLAGEDLPLNEGLLEPVRLHIPEGILSPPFPSDPARCPAVVGGNVETSQRLVDALLRALDLVACGQGTMNNVLFGDDGTSYYETVAGGAGAGPGFHGASGTQVHMTNTRITDVEVLEHRFPVRVERFGLRPGSGGTGTWRGGDGVVRELRFLRPLSLSLLTQHRKVAPYGIRGGGPGARGEQLLVSATGRVRLLPGIAALEVRSGDLLVLRTPGGGGCGSGTSALTALSPSDRVAP